MPLPSDLSSLLVRTRRYLARAAAGDGPPDDALLLASVGPPAGRLPEGLPPEVADLLAVADGFSLAGLTFYGTRRPALPVREALAILPAPPPGSWHLLGRTWDEDNVLLSRDDGHVRVTAGIPGAAVAGAGTAYDLHLADSVEDLLRGVTFAPDAGGPLRDPSWQDLLRRLDDVEPYREWLRFEAAVPNRRGTRPGVFALANGLARAERLTPEDHAWWRASNDAMNAAYPHPPAAVYDASERPPAQSWFRADAHNLIDATRGYLDLLDRYGIAWRARRSDDPGRVLYEDAHQLVAEPW